MTDIITYLRDGPVVTITLNEPEKRNSLSPEMVNQLVAAIARLENEQGVGCAILTGSGTSFSAGGNPRRMLEPSLYQDMSYAEIQDFYRSGIQRVALAFQELQVPVVAAVNGPAIGAGCDIACMCDLRIASDEAIFASSFVKFGLVPGDGGAWFLPRIIGTARAAELMLTGDKIDAAAALANGLVSAVTTPDALMDDARTLAGRVACNAPHAVRLAKNLLRECQSLSLAAALELSAHAQATCHKTEDHREAVRAFLEQRPPNFQGR